MQVQSGSSVPGYVSPQAAQPLRWGMWPFRKADGLPEQALYDALQQDIIVGHKQEQLRRQSHRDWYWHQVKEALADWDKHMRAKNGDPLLPLVPS